mmetsp:Transcript_2505/g.5312  ORF Transcript_2505/g.5312 Transcript_2505/m.5312 type:complete len:232 (-) Transcript_2505:106-801(-)|eukprot:CAMPEP_0172325318 /NCGR_PEP_ID=MMETSP1058-20130122/53691_1 /TAXON_ID=83371 /ORGANISM="Detonula confervacea, Strain CCMP 353" /LENGTH=231 /DNA_ID=CAMNT_0013041831 /DNA_START=37 /DNA_END=732 /DNA_ORIENTATION=+
MKTFVAISALSLVLATTDAQLSNAPKLLRAAGESKEWGRRQSHQQKLIDGGRTRELDSSSTSMSMPASEPDNLTKTEEEWSNYELSQTSLLKYRVNVPADTDAEECTGCSVSMEVIHDGEAWVGIAFSEDGKMVGSEAVIGTPEDGQVKKYDLKSKWPFGATRLMSDGKQTLTDASIEIVDGQTIMKFTKLMNEVNEIEILAGENIMLYARGSGPSLGYHRERLPFDLTLL